MSTPYYLDDFALKAWPTPFKAVPKEEFEEPQLTNAQILSNLALGKITWKQAFKTYDYLAKAIDPYSVKLWKCIRDGAHLQDLTYVHKGMNQLYKLPKESDQRKKILTFLHDKFDANAPLEDELEYHISWVDVYRKTHKMLDRIIETYTKDKSYTNFDKMFNHAGTAQYLKNEFLLEQTRPIGEAHIHLDIDEYTGVHQEKEDDYLRVPDHVTLEDHNGEMQTVQLTQLKDMSSWSGDLSDPDHEWYDEDAEGENPSQSMWQWENSELHVTPQYRELRSKYYPMVLEIIRRIEDSPIVKKADTFSKNLAREQAAESLINTRLARWFKHALKNEFRQGVPPQDIAALLMVDIPIPLKINGNLSTIIDQFGDDILDSIVDAPGLTNYPEYYWESALEEFHQQTIQLMEEKGVQHSPKWSSHFVVSAFKNIVEDQQPVSQAIAHAYDDFRSAISPAAANAFRQAIEDGKSEREAMRAFYETAKESGEYVSRDRILRANNERVIILTASSGYTEQRELSWKLFRYKANQGEIFVPTDTHKASKKWLLGKLKSLNWNDQLIAKLAE